MQRIKHHFCWVKAHRAAGADRADAGDAPTQGLASDADGARMQLHWTDGGILQSAAQAMTRPPAPGGSFPRWGPKSAPPPGGADIAWGPKSAPPPGEDDVGWGPKSAPPPGEDDVAWGPKSAPPPGEGDVAWGPKSAPPPGEDDVAWGPKSAPPPGESDVAWGPKSAPTPTGEAARMGLRPENLSFSARATVPALAGERSSSAEPKRPYWGPKAAGMEFAGATLMGGWQFEHAMVGNGDDGVRLSFSVVLGDRREALTWLAEPAGQAWSADALAISLICFAAVGDF